MNTIIHSLCIFCQWYFLIKIFTSTDADEIEQSRTNVFAFGICGMCISVIKEIPDIQLNEMAWFLIN